MVNGDFFGNGGFFDSPKEPIRRRRIRRARVPRRQADEFAEFAKTAIRVKRFFSTEAQIKRIQKKRRERRRKEVLRQLQAEERKRLGLKIARARVEAGRVVGSIKRRLKRDRKIYE